MKKVILVLTIIFEGIFVFAQDVKVIGPKKKNEPIDAPISTLQSVDLGLSVLWSGYNLGATSPELAGLKLEWNGAMEITKNSWGGQWRLPSKKECEELLKKCKWVWTKYKGIRGYKVVGPNGNAIFIPSHEHGFTLEGHQEYWVCDFWTKDKGNRENVSYLFIIGDSKHYKGVAERNQNLNYPIRPVCDKK